MAAAVGALDEMIKEYLVFRGFTNTLKYFDMDRKDDKDKGFKVNRIVDHILQCINKSDFNSLQSFWMYLNKRFFSRLNHDSLMTVYRLETGILRMFLVHASRQGRQDVVKEFFERMTVALHDRKEWKDWFTLPFTKSPEQHPSFKLYFSKDWSDAFVVTLHNFFSTLFACLPLPALLNFEAEHTKMQALATENHHLHNRLATTRQELADAESNVQKLEAKLSQLDARLVQQVATQAGQQSASRRSYSASGKTQKVALLGRLNSPMKKKTATPNANPPSKKPATKATSLEERMESAAATEKQRDGIEKQNSEPTLQQKTDSVSKHKELSLTSLDDKQEESDLDLTSPETPGVVDEGCVKSFNDVNGTAPFIPVSQETYKLHSAPVTHCKFSPNAKHIATVDTDGVMRVWDPSTLSTTATVELKSSLLSLDWAPQSDNLVLIGSGDSVVKLFETTTLRDHWEIKSDPKLPKILSIACSHSSSTFAFSAAASTVTTPQVHSGSSMTIGLTAPSLPSSRFSPSEMTSMNKSMSGSGDAAHLTSPRELPPGGLFIWDLKTQRQKCTLPISPMPVGINCMAFNHNSSLLITGGTDGIIRLFDVTQEECLFGWTAHEGEVFNVQFSSDETSVYSMGRDNKFNQWSINLSGKKMAQFNIHKNACQPTEGRLKGEYYPKTPRGNLFAFESEDKYVLTCAPEEALVYQVSSEGNLTKTLSISSQGGPVTCVDWLPGRRSYSTCVTASVDGCVRVTNLLRGNLFD